MIETCEQKIGVPVNDFLDDMDGMDDEEDLEDLDVELAALTQHYLLPGHFIEGAGKSDPCETCNKPVYIPLQCSKCGKNNHKECMFGNASKLECVKCAFAAVQVTPLFPPSMPTGFPAKLAPVNIRREGKVGEDIAVYPEVLISMRKPDSLISGTIVDAYLTLLVSYPANAGMEFISSATTSAIRFDQHTKIQVEKKERWLNASVLFTPLCLDKHWIMIVFLPKLNRVEVLNSIKGYAQEKIDTFLKNWESFSGKKPLRTLHPTFPQQPNGVDCGLYMLYGAFAIAFDLDWFHFGDMTLGRKYLIHCMHKNTLLSPPWAKHVVFKGRSRRQNVIILAPPQQHFQTRDSNPQVAGTMWGKDILTWSIKGVAELTQSTVYCALTQDSRKRHRNCLVVLQMLIMKHTFLQELPLAQAIVSAITAITKMRKWCPSTTLTFSGATAGAITRLDQYTNAPP